MTRPTRALSELGQSPWLDRITHDLLESGTLQRYVDQLSAASFVASWNSLVAAIKQKARSSPEGGAGG